MSKQDTSWLLTEKYAGVESEGFRTDCARLAAGEPLGYVIGHVPFLDCQIWLDSQPLIPRPETEYWTERAIKTIKEQQAKQSEPVRVLDLCAGSGAIGVAVAKAIPSAIITFAELDEAHLPTIAKNLTTNLNHQPSIAMKGLPHSPDNHPVQYDLIQSDLLQNITGTFDFILTNPPYINAAANTVEESVVEHEPHLALFGGEDGIEIIQRIIKQTPAKLSPHGQLWIEHEPTQMNRINSIAKEYFRHNHTHNDQYETPRFTVIDVAL